jgi:hypothetical protein
MSDLVDSRALFQRRPWLTQPVSLPREPVGMLGKEESSLFYFLTKEAFTGRGTIIDAGSFLGRSAVYLASGLLANPAFDTARDRVHCFDNFRVNEDSTVEFVRKHLNQELTYGQSTRQLFDAQIADVKHVIEVHEGDFHTVQWRRRPIEILMVDIAKSVSLGRRVAELFFRDLIPGCSLVVQQDYHHPWLPHIHVTMEFLADCFELVVPRCNDSAVFACKKAIPEAMLTRVVAYDFTADEQLALMDGALARLPVEDRAYLELARVLLIGPLRGWGAGRAAFDEVERRLDAFRGDRVFARYLEGTRDTVDEKDGWRQKRSGNAGEVIRITDAMLARGRGGADAFLMRGWAQTQLGMLAEGEQTLRRGIELPVHSGFAYCELAENLMLQRRADEAEATMVRCFADAAASPRAGTPYMCAVLQKTWDRNFTADRVRATLEKVRACMTSDADWWVFDARMNVRLGDRSEALSSLRKAAALGLAEPQLEAALRELGVSRAELR